VGASGSSSDFHLACAQESSHDRLMMRGGGNVDEADAQAS